MFVMAMKLVFQSREDREIFNFEYAFGSSGVKVKLNDVNHFSFPGKWHSLPQHIKIKSPL